MDGTADTGLTGFKPAVNWLFAGFRFDEGTLELTHGSTALAIERKPLKVLLYLLQHANEVATKEALQANVWPGRILSDTVLTKAIGRLREVLGDADQSIIKTVHGVGYRMIAPVRLELAAPIPNCRPLELLPGQHPPLRPCWTLEARLGGDSDDIWLVRHDGTREARTFKFAQDAARIISLKREIMLFGLLRGMLGCNAPIITLLGWNLEQPPYFIECDYVKSGGLADWLPEPRDTVGILLNNASERVERAIADSLAAAYLLGAIDKDLKPTGVLPQSQPNDPLMRVLLGSLNAPDRQQTDPRPEYGPLLPSSP